MSSRRSFLWQATSGLLTFPILAQGVRNSVYGEISQKEGKLPADFQKPAFTLGKARSVIEIWMDGGPSHLETFDPKPGAGPDYCGPWDKPLQTNANGIEISQSLPELAKVADCYSIIRTIAHGDFGHETAAYAMRTGRRPGGHTVYPMIGTVIGMIKQKRGDYKFPLPPQIILTGMGSRFSPSGFLGPRYLPLQTGGNPAAQKFVVSGYVLEGIDDNRRENRRQMLEEFESVGLGGFTKECALCKNIDLMRKDTYELLGGDAVKTFDLSEEPENIRQSYGMTSFGQSCLAARRLVEKGVPFITVNLGGWDTHSKHFETLTRRQGEWDKALAMLFKDLRDRKLLDSTIVLWNGEFGRTPRIDQKPPWFGGRGHHGSCFNILVGGGGFKGGTVIGSSNRTGDVVESRPVQPRDFLASIYIQLGIDPYENIPNDQNIEIPIMDAPSPDGILKEIMT